MHPGISTSPRQCGDAYVQLLPRSSDHRGEPRGLPAVCIAFGSAVSYPVGSGGPSREFSARLSQASAGLLGAPTYAMS